jgi:hypothetical protein
LNPGVFECLESGAVMASLNGRNLCLAWKDIKSSGVTFTSTTNIRQCSEKKMGVARTKRSWSCVGFPEKLLTQLGK